MQPSRTPGPSRSHVQPSTVTWVDVVSSDDNFPTAILPQNEGRSSTNAPRLTFPSEVQKWQADIMKLVKAPQNERQQVQIHG